MPRLTSAVVLLLLGSPAALPGQEATDRERIATVTAGIGNTMGWLGVQGERYFAHERLSAFLGLGYTPSIDLGDPSGLSFAVGGRGFTAGVKHRGFLAVSLARLFVENGGSVDSGRFKGPGVEVGYQIAWRGGFTAMLGVGAGYAPGMREGQIAVGSMIELSF